MKPSDSTEYVDWRHCMVEYEDGRQFEWGFVETRNPVVAILAVDSTGAIGLVEQYRYAFGAEVIEIIKGFAKPGEAPLDAAKRELLEELGTSAHHWKSLGTIPTSPGLGRILNHCFLAYDLFDAHYPLADNSEPPERLKIHWMPLGDFFREVAVGRIADSVTIAAVTVMKVKELFNFQSAE